MILDPSKTRIKKMIQMIKNNPPSFNFNKMKSLEIRLEKTTCADFIASTKSLKQVDEWSRWPLLMKVEIGRSYVGGGSRTAKKETQENDEEE